MERTKRWLSLVRMLPSDLQTNADLLAAIQLDDEAGVILRLEQMETETRREMDDFIASHAEERRLSRIDFWDLTNLEKAQVEWFEGERASRGSRLTSVHDGVRFARDIAGIEPYWPSKQDE